MQSKTSWFNKELMIQSFRNVGWIGIVYLVGLLFAVPLRVLMLWSDPNRHGDEYIERFENIFTIMFPIQLVLMFAVPILLAIFLFRYLQVKSASDFMHSLPVKRTTLYNQYVGLGVLYLVVPIVVTVLILVLMHTGMGLDNFFTIGAIFSWGGITLVITLLVFLAGVFVGMVTGISAVQGVLTFILLLFPAGISMMFMYNLNLYLFGFLPNYYFEKEVMILSPVTKVVSFQDYMYREDVPDMSVLSGIEILTYIAIALLLYGLGMWLYKIRNLETVLHSIVFRQLRPVFKYGVTFCMMLLGGLYFGESQNGMEWAVFGYVVGSLIGYFVAEMLLQKTWRVFTHLKGYFIYAVVIVLVGFMVHFDVTGYEGKVPELDEIERVYFAENSYGYIDELREGNVSHSQILVGNPIDTHKPFFDEKENIKTIRSLHKTIIENKDIVKDPIQGEMRNAHSVFIAYELKNGDKLVRQYVLPDNEVFTEDLKQIYSSKEYKEAKYEVLHVEPSDVDQITVRPHGPVDKRAIIADPEEIAAALEALKEDVMDVPYDLTNNHFEEPGSDITIVLDDAEMNHIQMDFSYSYESFENVLKQQGKLDDARITAEDISFMVIVKRETAGSHHKLYNSGQSPVYQMLEYESAWKITSKEQISQLLQSTTGYRPDSEYYVGIQYKEKNYEEIRELSQRDAPDFVIQHFK